MKRPTSGVGQQPNLWLLFLLRLRKFVKVRSLLILFFLLIIIICLHGTTNHASSDQPILDRPSSTIAEEIENFNNTQWKKCNYDEIEAILQSASLDSNSNNRPQPTIERLHKLFKILISNEDEYREIFHYLGIFRFTDINNTLRPFANNTERLQYIYCHFKRYINVSDKDHITIPEDFVNYLRKVSSYLAKGFKNKHATWSSVAKYKIQKPVIVLAANMQFYEALQASMRTIDTYFKNSTVAIYDLGLKSSAIDMIKDNCDRCIIIPFPFDKVETVAPHIRILGNFAWKPIVVQDAVRRFGSIIYGDSSIRYKTSDFNHLLIDNLIRGFACRELPGHYLPCFTLSATLAWFGENPQRFKDVYIAEAGFVAVTDNFLSRLILKTWVTCALDANCISPSNSKTFCPRYNSSSYTHRYDQSAMVTLLSFYFFPSSYTNSKTDPAPYDMYSSIQRSLADVHRFEGDRTYFTKRTNVRS